MNSFQIAATIFGVLGATAIGIIAMAETSRRDLDEWAEDADDPWLEYAARRANGSTRLHDALDSGEWEQDHAA